MRPMSRGVNAIIFSKDQKKVLVIKRRDVPLWVLPGGRVEEAESCEEAVLRETVEETGCQVSILRKTAVYYPVNRLASTAHVYVCEMVAGSPQIGEETDDIDFFPLTALPEPFFHIHKDFIEDAMSGDLGVAEKKLTQASYWEIFKYFLRHPIRVLRFILSQLGFPLNKTKKICRHRK